MTTATNSKSIETGAKRTQRQDEHATMETLREDVRDLGRDLGKLKTDAIDATAGVANSAIAGVRTGAETAIEGAKRAQTEVSDWVSHRPITSLLIAIGVGAIAARLMTRR